jgi:hypothetical protein
VSGLVPAQAASWRRVFSSTKVQWQADYSDIPWPVASGPAMFVPSDERSAPAEPRLAA